MAMAIAPTATSVMEPFTDRQRTSAMSSLRPTRSIQPMRAKPSNMLAQLLGSGTGGGGGVNGGVSVGGTISPGGGVKPGGNGVCSASGGIGIASTLANFGASGGATSSNSEEGIGGKIGIANCTFGSARS